MANDLGDLEPLTCGVRDEESGMGRAAGGKGVERRVFVDGPVFKQGHYLSHGKVCRVTVKGKLNSKTTVKPLICAESSVRGLRNCLSYLRKN